MRWIWLAPVIALSGCGVDVGEQVECRCTEDMLDDFASSCVNETGDPANPLSTRLPDCPSGTPIFLRERTTPFTVLFNVETTITNFSPNQYMDQLTDDFLFVPDPGDIALHPEIYDAPPNYNPALDTLWAWQAERTFVRSLLDQERMLKIDFARWYESSKDEVIISEDGLMETYIFPYEIDFQERPVDGVSAAFGVKGRVEVDLVTPTTENPVWAISRIVDIRDAATAKRSFGELRAEFAQ